MHTPCKLYTADNKSRITRCWFDSICRLRSTQMTAQLYRGDWSTRLVCPIPCFTGSMSYLNGRSQFVRVGQEKSPTCEYGVPHGPDLGPLLYTLYVAPIAEIIPSFNTNHLQFADDTQRLTAPTSVTSLYSRPIGIIRPMSFSQVAKK